MSSEVFQPLMAVADSYIGEASPKLTPEVLSHLKTVMHKFINGEIQFEEASNEFQKNISTTRPIDRINAILNVSSTPISPSDNSSNQMTIINGPRKKTHPWSEYEDQRLLAAIHKYGLDNWAPVSVFVGNKRTRAQCSQRWFRGLDPRISKVLWTSEEETKLKQLIERYGDRAWTKISSELGNRSDAQCRYHYRQMMKEAEGGNNNTSPLALDKKISSVMSAPARTLRAEIANRFQSPSSLINPSPSSISRTTLPPISSILSAIKENTNSVRFANLDTIPPLFSPQDNVVQAIAQDNPQ